MTAFQSTCMICMALFSFAMAIYGGTKNDSVAEFFIFAGFGVGYIGLAGVYT